MRTSTRSTAGRSASTSSSRQSFPSQLHHMLDDAELKGFDDIVSWQPHGRCFVVHKVTEFVDQILPNYFRQSKFPSFQRQLNLYEFSRITRGKDRNGYYHDRFLRDMPELSECMNKKLSSAIKTQQPVVDCEAGVEYLTNHLAFLQDSLKNCKAIL